MPKKLIKLLEKQIEKLEAEDFDLEAWKSSATSVLTRIFGADDPRIKQVDQLKVDYSSWALRDSNAQYKPVESCKRKGKALMISAVEELETFGLPANQSKVLEDFFEEEEIKILLSESKDLKKIVSKLKKKDLEKLVLKLLKR